MLYVVIVPIIPEYLMDLRRNAEQMNKDYRIQQLNWTAFNLTYFNTTLWPENLTYVTPTPTIPQHIRNKFDKNWHTFILIDLPAPPMNHGNEGQLSISVLIASKAIFQLLINPFTGMFIDRVGYDLPIMTRLSIIFMSTSVFAFGKS
ncbi:hypothetical protein DPMN_180947 [Dreissena polymorpha]|uniref:Uncharacterized protein n=1 Tax=Dreissena polymorpha TaxID=45954 RepID=A0A9D4DFA0_DREPO|nr:hypothetical protein DPMN_180947 [Dreissena polymorpha]